MNVLDILLALPLLWALYKGFSKGLVLEIASLMALILGVYAALHFSFYMSDLLVEHFDWDKDSLPLVSFALTFIVVVVGISLLGRLLTGLLKLAALGLVNRLAGALFALLKVGFVLSVILSWLAPIDKNMELLDPKLREESKLMPIIAPVASIVIPALKEKGWGEWTEPLQPQEDLTIPISL